MPPQSSPRSSPLSPVALIIIAALIAIGIPVVVVGGFVGWRLFSRSGAAPAAEVVEARPAGGPDARPVAPPPQQAGTGKQRVNAPPAAERPAAPGTDADPEKEAFLAVVRKNADDPAGLEITEWGPRRNNGRIVKFRCKQVSTTVGGQRQPQGVNHRGGVPVLLEQAEVSYDGDKIKEVFLGHSYRVWHP
jgi:hypothetical protein